MNRFTSRVRYFWQWIHKKPKKITIPVTVIILSIVSFGGYQFAQLYDYMENDPNFCQSCHVMEESWNRWATSVHKEVGCHSCHLQSWFTSAKLLISFVSRSYERVEKHAVVIDKACKKCHEGGDPKGIQVAATAGHYVHAEKQNIACVKCHSVSLHRFEPPGPICNVCHEDKHVEVEGMAAMHCTACHMYLAEADQLLPLRKSCLDCHRALTGPGVDWPPDAPMQYPCGDCHQPHKQAGPIVDCLSCHSVEGMHSEGTHSVASCLACHKPHDWVVTQRETCMTCHPGQAQHNAGIFCGSCHVFSEMTTATTTAKTTTTAPAPATTTAASTVTASTTTPKPTTTATTATETTATTPTTTTTTTAAGPPRIPASHVVRTSACDTCHATGIGEAPKWPTPPLSPDHTGFAPVVSIAICQSCHTGP